MVDYLPTRSDHGVAAVGPWEALDQVPMIKFLEYDRRPIFVINLAHENQGPDDQLHPFFANQALYKSRPSFDLHGGILTYRNVEDYMEFNIFVAWAKAPSPDGHTSQFHFGGIAWESLTLDGIWRIFTGTLLSPSRRLVHDDSVSEPSFTNPPTDVSSNESSETTTATQKSATKVGEIITQLNLSPRDTRRSSDSGLSNDVYRSSQSTVSMEAGSSLSFFDNPATNAMQEDTPTAKRNADLLSKIAASGSIAIYILDISGEIIFCNDAWYEISQHPRELKNAMSWMSIAADDEIPKIKKLWERVAIHQEPIQWQARLKRHWKPPLNLPTAPKDLSAWISGWSYPDISPEGEVIGVCGVLTDISEQKWMESLVQQKLADAIERASLMEQLSISTKEVVESETRFRRLADLMPIGIWVSDQDGKMLYVNNAFRDIIPGSNDPNVIQPWWELVPEEEMHKAQESYRELTELRIKSSVELRLKKSGDADDDEYRWIHLIGYPELREDGTLRHITGCVADITQLKLAEQAQSNRATDALKSKRQLEHFIDMTSHEIRNPLSAIIHSAEEIVSSLRRRGSEIITAETITDVMEAAKTIIYCTDHSTRIVDDILLVSKLESGLVNINPTVIRPVDAVRRALKMFDGEMRAADITQSFLVDDSFQQLGVDWVYLDESRMLQIFVNLIANAIKFTRPERTRRIDVQVAASEAKPNEAWNHFLAPQTETAAVCRSFEANDNDSIVFIQVTVRDTGCGLSEDEQKRLFRRFSQAGKRTHVKYGGTGLGLFISRQLSEMQGGQIGVHSVPQQGSVFSFYIMGKRALPHEQPLGIIGSIEQVRTGRVASISQPVVPPSLVAPSCPEVPLIILDTENDIISPREQIILLVEDNLINQKVVAKKLKTEGFTVVVANNGLEALEHIRKSSLWSTSSADAPAISLILLDIEMPIMDGLTCIRCIREMEKSGEIRSRIPVIAVTANARQERINQIKEAGMDDVITKPFRMNQLTPVMMGYLKQSLLSPPRRPSIPKVRSHP